LDYTSLGSWLQKVRSCTAFINKIHWNSLILSSASSFSYQQSSNQVAANIIRWSTAPVCMMRGCFKYYQHLILTF
jgi:hypothetical protein